MTPPPATPAPDQVERFPLSSAERGIVIASLASEEEYPFNIPLVVDFTEPVDAERLAAAAAEYLSRTKLLRRRFHRGREGLYAEYAADHEPVPVENLTQDEAAAFAATMRVATLDAPLVRMAVVRTVPTGQVALHLVAHHGLLDGTSAAILLRSVLESYEAGQHVPVPAPLPATQVAVPEKRGWTADPDFDQFVRGVRARRDGRTAFRPVVVRVPGRASFARSLAAFATALAAWSAVRRVYFSTVLLGRDRSTAAALGAFVKLRHVVLDVEQPEATYEQARAVGIDLALRSTGISSPASDGDHDGGVLDAATSRLGVVFDYKTESFLQRALDTRLGATVAADETYRDDKYDLHFCVVDADDEQVLTIETSVYSEADLDEIARGYQLARDGIRAA